MRSASAMPNFQGLTAFMVMSSVAARFFGPQVSGIGATPGGDQRYSASITTRLSIQTTHLQYQPWKKRPWFGFNWRYDSGLVAGPVPCAGGNCANGPNGTDSVVDVSGPDARSTVRGGTLLRQRACHAHHSDQPDRPLPGVAVRIDAGIDSRRRHGKRRPQPAPHSAAQSVRRRRGT